MNEMSFLNRVGENLACIQIDDSAAQIAGQRRTGKSRHARDFIGFGHAAKGQFGGQLHPTAGIAPFVGGLALQHGLHALAAGGRWVDARVTDDAAATRWNQKKPAS